MPKTLKNKVSKDEKKKTVKAVKAVKAVKKEKKSRLSKLSRCIRNTSATLRLKPHSMPDSPKYDPSIFTSDVSSKFKTLIEKIEQLDAQDMEEHGTKFKHFIYTDIRESAFGAKAVASFLKASGYDLRMDVQKKFIKRNGVMVETKFGETKFLNKDPVEKGSNGFAVLQAQPLWKNPLSVDTKKDIIRAFNSRPENIHGERLRIIVLDSKYKEGIDLFDVKYVHLLEPPIANSDLKQAVGRATRFCGQKGLVFLPNKGWQLHVFIYSTSLPNRAPFQLDDSEAERIDAHDVMMARSGLDLALLNIVKELTILAISSSVDYDLNYKMNNLTELAAVLDATDPAETVIAEVILPDYTERFGGARKPKSKQPQLVEIHSVKDITPELLQKCYRRKSILYPFSRARMEREARRLKLKIPKKAKRNWYCNQLETVPKYLDILLKPEVDTGSIQTVSGSPRSKETDSIRSMDVLPNNNLSYMNYVNPFNNVTPSPLKKISITSSPSDSMKRYSATPYSNSITSSPSESMKDEMTPAYSNTSYVKPNTVSPYTNALMRVRKLFPSPYDEDELPSIQDFFEAQEAKAEFYALLQSLKHKSFQEFQQAILQMYGKFKWEAPIIKNACLDTQLGAQGKAVSFTKTQDFVRHYLSPDLPFKGLLAWHSVGTGKTCMAVATATTEFEKAGYSILWVTRNSLMADVYKNIFGSVCSIPMIEKLESGLVLPSNLKQQKTLLSKLWFPPISYRTFQNALEGKNELGRYLKEKHPSDPLYKTFLIMDEVHKLQDGDLGAAESADFTTIQKYIHESYEKSGKQSVRPLLMTATPITDSPNELFAILNTLIEKEKDRLLPFQEFREQFTTSDGLITKEGKEYFQTRAKGLISYLNREYDPTTFAQPVFHKIVVPLYEKPIPTVDDIIARCIPIDSPIQEPEIDMHIVQDELDSQIQSIESSNLSKKEKRAEIAMIKRAFTQKKRNIQRSKKQRMQSRKQQIKEARECYKEYKKESKVISQINGIQGCFDKKLQPKFPSFKEVSDAV